MKGSKTTNTNVMRDRIKGKTPVYMKLPILFSIVFLCLSGIVFYNNRTEGIIAGSVSLSFFVLTTGMYAVIKAKYLRELVDFAMDYTQVQKHLIKDLEMPYGLIDKAGKFLWANDAFNEEIDNSSNKSVTAIFEGISDSDFTFEKNETKKEVDISYDGKYYKVEFNKVILGEDFSGAKHGSAGKEGLNNAEKNEKSEKIKKKRDTDKTVEADTTEESGKTEEPETTEETEEYLIAVYLFDETEIKRLAKENVDQKLVAGLIYLDNYDDALESVEDVRRSLLVALIDRKINKYFAAYNAVIKKLEKDKYFIIIKQKYVSLLQSNKFSILDEVKTVNIGNEMAVTVSIGLGVNGEEYTQNCEYSRIAMDLALGRGGDQAVIKDGEKIYFYGGKSKQVEKNTRVKARVKAHALRELLETKEKVIIMGHKIGDIDSFGSAIGIYRAAKTINKRAYIVINEITTSIRPMLEKFIGNENYEEDMIINSDKAIEVADTSTVVVVVDVNRPSYVECPELLTKVKSIVVLDHHRQSSEVIENAALSYIEPFASSASEMVAEILQYISDGIKIRQCEADAMYAGIMIDTNNFSNKAGVRTFEAAAFLRKNGADVIRVRKMFRDNIEDYKAKAEAIKSAEIFNEVYAIGVCPAEGLDSPTVVGAQAANELLNIRGIKASFVLTEHNNKIYVSARSMGDLNVQLVMEKFSGGGHIDMAGAQLENMSIEEAKTAVKEALIGMIEAGEV